MALVLTEKKNCGQKWFGSSGRTRTYSPSVNSPTRRGVDYQIDHESSIRGPSQKPVSFDAFLSVGKMTKHGTSNDLSKPDGCGRGSACGGSGLFSVSLIDGARQGFGNGVLRSCTHGCSTTNLRPAMGFVNSIFRKCDRAWHRGEEFAPEFQKAGRSSKEIDWMHCLNGAAKAPRCRGRADFCIFPCQHRSAGF